MVDRKFQVRSLRAPVKLNRINAQELSIRLLPAPLKRFCALVIEKAIDHDFPEPGIKAGFASEGAKRFIRSQPHFLGQIFGSMSIAAIVQREIVDSALVSLRQKAKSLRITGLGQFN